MVLYYATGANKVTSIDFESICHCMILFAYFFTLDMRVEHYADEKESVDIYCDDLCLQENNLITLNSLPTCGKTGLARTEMGMLCLTSFIHFLLKKS